MVTLFKLAITAETETTVLTKPNVERFFYTLDPQHIDQGTLTIPANAFVDDQGNPVEDITLVTENNGYYLLFINGVLQQEGLYTVTAANVQVIEAGDIPENAPITLIVTNFEPDAESETTIIT
ncbi:DUF4183 domain-containing protein [Anaerobranca gottschalkii]|uniref:DUF4183 domain-containing protein n=1 Tax=Anaerobranca gottschalkii DSM 13577 TaxID=1120990 RepID=A0A1I0C8J3_9FIRM|nr:DUF4183 domain-containing protein [Anaerobranca gottschalkii]SET15706.1 protein of unknown function [Anaerobranca gottschalkii DSM 13577]